MTLEELIVPSRRSSTSTTTPENLGDGLPGNLETPDNKSIFGPALSATIAPEDAIDRESLVDLEDSRRTETVPEISTYHNSDDLSPGNSETSSDDSAHSRSSHSVTSWEDCPEHSPPIIVSHRQYYPNL